MNDFRQRPRGTFIETAHWQELYILSKHWKSDLLFYKEDLQFLHRLINKYIIWLTKSKNIEMVRRIENDVNRTRTTCKDLFEKVQAHLRLYEKIEKDKAHWDDVVFRKEHEILEDELAEFVKEFRKNRKEVFKITEYVVDSEQLVSILES